MIQENSNPSEVTSTDGVNDSEQAPQAAPESPPKATIRPEDLFKSIAQEIDQYGFPIEDEIDLDQLPVEDDYNTEEREQLEYRYIQTMKEFRPGQLIMGRVVSINDNDVSIDIGFKSEGNIPKEEFDTNKDLKVGDEIEVCIDNVEGIDGSLVLSKKKAEIARVWERINEYYLTAEIVEAEVIKRIKGGMVVDLFGIEAFLPGSQIDVHPVRDFDALINTRMDFRIIKVNNQRKNVVLSRKVLVEESLRGIREKVLAQLEEGQVVEGVVKNITDFGVFVDLGGVDGLLHITDLSWGRVSHPSDIVQLDKKIQVKVLTYDKERSRISLGLKQLQEHHWNDVEQRYPVSTKAMGKVIAIVKYGAFIELEPGIEGLVHISEMSWTQHIKHPSQMVSVGDALEVVILSIDKENRKISLGIKQLNEDPWETLEQKYTINSLHKGVVRDLVPFGAFVELESDIDGLIHISDLSWTKKVRHPAEIVKKGQEIEVVVLSFDRNERRIALGYKQREEDPWGRFEREYPIRTKTDGTVMRLLEKGVIVALPLGVEGFVPNSQLGKSILNDPKKKLREGEVLELEVIEFDKASHRIVLSNATIERAREKELIEEFGSTEKAAEETAEVKTETSSEETQAEVIAAEGTETTEVSEPIAEEVEIKVEENSDNKSETKETDLI